MTQEDTLRYTEAVQEYERHKSHFYLLSHDDLSLGKYLKALFSDRSVIKIFIICYLVATLFLGLVFGFFLKTYLSTIEFVAVALIVFCLFLGIKTFFLYLNYVSGDFSDTITADFFYFFFVFSAGYETWKHTNNIYCGIAVGLAVFYVGLRIYKSVLFDKENPKPSINDYDMGVVEMNRIRDLKQRIADNWQDVLKLVFEGDTANPLKSTGAKYHAGELLVTVRDEKMYVVIRNVMYQTLLSDAIKKYAGETVDFKFAFYRNGGLHWD